MLVDNSTYRNAYTANGSTKVFTISFPFLDASHIVVYQKIGEADEVKIPSSQYTISGVGNPRGGTLTMNTAPAAGTKIAILRDIPITQLYNYTELDNFPAEAHENALAKLTMICQQLMELANRHLTIPATSLKTPQEVMDSILTIADQANEYLTQVIKIRNDVLELKNNAQGLITQTGDEQAERVEQTGDEQAERVEQAGDAKVREVQAEGQTQIDRLAGYADIGALAEGLAAAMQVWTLAEDTPAGSTITLPNEMLYVPGHRHLWLALDGMVLSPSFFTEQGKATDTSSSIVINMDLAAGQELMAWVIPLGKAYEIELTQRVVALENALGLGGEA